jgi:hypothetical protein
VKQNFPHDIFDESLFRPKRFVFFPGETPDAPKMPEVKGAEVERESDTETAEQAAQRVTENLAKFQSQVDEAFSKLKGASIISDESIGQLRTTTIQSFIDQVKGVLEDNKVTKDELKKLGEYVQKELERITGYAGAAPPEAEEEVEKPAEEERETEEEKPAEEERGEEETEKPAETPEDKLKDMDPETRDFVLGILPLFNFPVLSFAAERTNTLLERMKDAFKEIKEENLEWLEANPDKVDQEQIAREYNWSEMFMRGAGRDEFLAKARALNSQIEAAGFPHS